ncbi:MAG: bifunctional pantoate--beta-alanine ligase/(d)CMP kinase [Leptolyngbyaceae cyanobacterium bins.349]|nr:bifunctional pantoate--beta-alanine ligase/(d)CMP kinase [Leptolyngbyaceae cyanobacterium bins.349]
MRLFKSIAGLRCYLNSQRFDHRRLEHPSASPQPFNHLPLEIGFVPTMGALHQGHLSLINRARHDNKVVVVSIFVNPLQFGPHEDLQRYPRTLDADMALCAAAGVDALFVPSVEEMGVEELLTQIHPAAAMTAGLCGRSRVGHFQGVATIVTKLLNIVQPTRAYFGQKDAQQLAIIQRLVHDLNLPVEVVACPILREASGLAMSSRNRYLQPEEQDQATAIYRGLYQAEQLFRSGERLSSTLVEAVKAELRQAPAIAPEYIELVDPTTMETLNEVKDTGLLAVAARLGTTRLIDNVLLSRRLPIVAIDGPAGAGKSTVARRVAQTLNLFYLDTGAMYRALTWFALESGVAVDDEPAIADLVSQCQIEFKNSSAPVLPHASMPAATTSAIVVNGQDVTKAIRSLEVTSQVSTIAAQPTVREQLVKRQQSFGRQGGVVMEGRDIGTYVFPDAEVKVFLTASVQERARRRQQDLLNRGIGEVNIQDLEQAISDRDRKDSTRLIAPLRKATDAVEIITDDLTIHQVCDRIVGLYQERLTALSNG